MSRILISNHDEQLACLLSDCLETRGHTVETFRVRAPPIARDWDLILLEWPLAGHQPLALSPGLVQPAVLAFGDANPANEIAALQSGADAYLRKPFTAALLEAHVAAALRKSTSRTPSSSLQSPAGAVRIAGPFRLDATRHCLWVDGTVADVRGSLFRLFSVLFDHPDQPVPRHILQQAASGTGTHVSPNCLDQHISRLRKALGEYGQLVATHRGLGFSLRVQPRDD